MSAAEDLQKVNSLSCIDVIDEKETRRRSREGCEQRPKRKGTSSFSRSRGKYVVSGEYPLMAKLGKLGVVAIPLLVFLIPKHIFAAASSSLGAQSCRHKVWYRAGVLKSIRE